MQIQTRSQNQHPHYRIVWGLIVAGLIAYTIPWINNPGSGLTLGAFDLAEWASLHPLAYTTTPYMLPSLLLRIHLLWLVWLLAINTPPPTRTLRWWFSASVALLLVIGQIPPLEFFSVARDNPNYQQQIILTLASLLGGIVALSGRFYVYRALLTLLIAFGGVITSLTGLLHTQSWMQPYSVPTQAGPGGPLMMLVYIGLIAYPLWTMVKENRATEMPSLLSPSRQISE